MSPEIDGVHLVRGEPGQRQSALLPGRDPIAFTSAAEALLVATTEAEGVRLIRVGGDLRAVPEPALALTRRDVRDLALFRTWGGYVLVAGLESSFAVVTLDPSAQVLETVRHPLRAPLQSLRAAEAGGRIALALTYVEGDRIDGALLDRSGALREKPHTLLRGTLRDGRVHWDEHGFRVSARDGKGALHSRRMDHRESQVLVEDVHLPFAIHHHYGQTFVAAYEADRLHLWMRGHDHLVHPGVIPLVSEDQPRLERIEQVRELGERWIRLRQRGGYRGEQEEMRWSPRELEGVFPPRPDAPRGLRIRFVSNEEGHRLVVVVGEPGEEPPDTHWARLVRWLGRRLSPAAREARERALATVRPIVGDELPEGAELTALGDAVLLELPLGELPSAERLEAWARAVLMPR